MYCHVHVCMYIVEYPYKEGQLGKGEEGFLKLKGELEIPEPWLDDTVRRRRGEGW